MLHWQICGGHGVFFLQPASLPSFLETGFLTKPEVHPLDLAGLPGNSWNPFSLPLTLEGYKHVWLFMWVPEIQT